MITRVLLDNFRAHEHTEIVLNPDDQIIAVSGPNGAGKSSLLEAITFALFGQGRTPSTKLDALVRRGGELAGMSVELDFTLSGSEYRVSRRRSGGVSSAVLACDGVPMVDGVTAVNSEIAQLLGTDAVGFRLAAVAQQTEVAALIHMASKPRVKAVNRLLRIDAVSRAREGAHSEFSEARRALELLGSPDDRERLRKDVTEAEEEFLQRELAEAGTRAELARLERIIATNHDLVDIYQAARDRLSAAAAAERAASVAHTAAVAALNDVDLPDLPADFAPIDIDMLTAAATDTQVALAAAEQSEAQAHDRQVTEEALQSIRARIAEIDTELTGTQDDAVAAVTAAEAELTAIQEEVRRSRMEAEEAFAAVAVARQQMTEAERHLAAIIELDGMCVTCHQEIPDGHRHTMTDDARTAVDRAQQNLDAAADTHQQAADRVEQAAAREAECERHVLKCTTDVETRFQLAGERTDLDKRATVYTERLSRLTPAGTLDVDVARQQADAAAAALAAGRQLEARITAHTAASQLHQERAAVHARTEAALTAAQHELFAAVIPEELTARWASHVDAQGAHQRELELLSVLTRATADARAAFTAAKEAFARNEEALARCETWREKGTVASYAKEILNRLEQHVGSNSRPAIEAVASATLDQLSEGRFPSLTLTRDFEPRVFDGGDYRPVSELSGGEADLVAISLRLALADVVSVQAGSEIGFLILDEVLGSLDSSRREATLNTIRSLRDRFGQVWMISHVQGLDDFADRVIDIDRVANGISVAA